MIDFFRHFVRQNGVFAGRIVSRRASSLVSRAPSQQNALSALECFFARADAALQRCLEAPDRGSIADVRGDELAARGVIPREPLEPKRRRTSSPGSSSARLMRRRLLVQEAARPPALPRARTGDEDVAGLDEAVREAGVPRDVDDDRARGLAVEGIATWATGKGGRPSGGRFGEGEVGRRGRGVFFDTRASLLFFEAVGADASPARGPTAPNASYCLAALLAWADLDVPRGRARGLTETRAGWRRERWRPAARPPPCARRPRARATTLASSSSRVHAGPRSRRAGVPGAASSSGGTLSHGIARGSGSSGVRLVPVEGRYCRVSSSCSRARGARRTSARASRCGMRARRRVRRERVARDARREAARGGERSTRSRANEAPCGMGRGGCGGRARGRASFGGVAPSRFSKEIGGRLFAVRVLEL